MPMLPRIYFVALFALCGLFSSAPGAIHDILSYNPDQFVNEQYVPETVLSATNVNPTNFGKLFSYTADGQVYAQPLYKSAVGITSGAYAGTTHNVVFIATENDSVYAFDADGSAGSTPLWQINFLNATGVTPVPSDDTGSGDLSPQIGITGTPVIDPSTNTLFVVAKTKEVVSGANTYVLRLHAIDITSGSEKAGSPTLIADTGYVGSGTAYTYISGPQVSGTGDGSVGGKLTYNALREHQRPALCLLNGTVYVATASHGDNGPFHGWVLGFSATTYQLTAAWCDSPNGAEAGIWQGGGGLPVDAAGNFYFITGNGSFQAPTFDTPTSSYINGNYGDSFVKLTADTVKNSSTNQNSNGWGLKVADYFTPSNQQNLSNGDLDLGSGGLLLLPDSVGSGTHPHLLVGGGKQGTVYLIDRDHMGEYNSGTDQIVQEQAAAILRSYSTPAYYNGVFFYGGNWSPDPGHSFTISNGTFAASNATPDVFGFTGSSPCISGTSANDPNAIVWVLDSGNASNQMRAYKASNYSQEIYTTAQAANNRDLVTGNTCKFAVVMVANTRVYVPTKTGLIVYGLINGPPTVAPATPANLVAAGVNGSVVSLAWTDNSNNEAGFFIEQSSDGVNFSQVGSVASNIANYAVTGLQPATKYYFRVRAWNTIGNSAYTNIANATTLSGSPLVDFSAGFASSGTALSYNNTSGTGNATVVGTALQLSDGGTNEARSVYYANKVNISQFQTQFDVLISNTNNSGDGFTFCIQNNTATSTGGSGGGEGYSGIKNSIAVKFNLYPSVDQTGLYTSGTSPNNSAGFDTTASGIDFRSGHILRVVFIYNGTTLTQTITDLTTSAVFTQSYTINIPTTVGATTAYVGFTAGSGGSTYLGQILNWTYTIPPAGPTNLTATANSGSQLTLNWTDNSTNESGYTIQRANDSAFTVNATTFFAPPVISGSGSYIDTDLTGGTQYYYQVYATDAAGNSTFSNVTNITMPVAPLTPSGLHATLISTGTINLLWTDNSNNESGFYLYLIDVDTGDENLIATLPQNTTSYSDISLSAGTNYDFHLQAYNVAGINDFVGVAVTTLCAAPSTPSASPGPSMVTLLWGAPNGAASYNVYRSTTSGGEGATPYQPGVANSFFTDNGVINGTQYFYKVSAINDVGAEGPLSAETSTTPYSPVVTIATNISPAQEATSTTGSFLLTRTGDTSNPLTVSLSAQAGSGQAASTRYTLTPALPNVTIPAGQSTTGILVTPRSDLSLVGTQNVTLNINASGSYTVGSPSSAVVTMLDTPYNAWKIQVFGNLGAAQSASDTASTSGDGISNLMKYALGLPPSGQNAGNLPVGNIQSVDGGTYLTLTLTIPKPAPSDITYYLETTPDLTSGTWTPAQAVTGYPLDNKNGTQTLDYRDTIQDGGAHNRSFIRLRVTRP